jgi:hypothetical protein
VAEAVWKSGTTETPVSKMATPHIKNAISKVERELGETSVTDATAKQSILESLKAEYATRSDAETA